MRLWAEEHGDYLLRYTLRHFPDREAARDLVQETFLAAIKSANSFAGKSAVRTWLTSILRNKIVDCIRRRTRERRLSLGIFGDSLDLPLDQHNCWYLEAQQAEWRINPEAATEQRQFGTIFDGCLKSLPEKQRKVFVMRELEGLSRSEIAAVSGLSPTNIGVILHRARLMLRESVKHNWPGICEKG